MKRGFERVSSYDPEDVHLPVRATQHAAGYDLFAARGFTLPSIWRGPFLKVLRALRREENVTDAALDDAWAVLKPYLVPTGVKAYMQEDEIVLIADRSSGQLKRGLILPNGIGVVDADYYNNPNNEGELFVQLLNFGIRDYHVKQGERIAQAIFMPYLRVDNEQTPLAKRTGGFGSSGK